MTPRQWEIHEANVAILTNRMDNIIATLSQLVQAIEKLPNITQEIVDLTKSIQADTEELHGNFHAK